MPLFLYLSPVGYQLYLYTILIIPSFKNKPKRSLFCIIITFKKGLIGLIKKVQEVTPKKKVEFSSTTHFHWLTIVCYLYNVVVCMILMNMMANIMCINHKHFFCLKPPTKGNNKSCRSKAIARAHFYDKLELL